MSTRKKYGITKEKIAERKEEKKALLNKTKLYITLPDESTYEIIAQIKEILDICEPGNAHVFLVHNGQKMRTSYVITFDDVCKEKLSTIIDPSAIAEE